MGTMWNNLQAYLDPILGTEMSAAAYELTYSCWDQMSNTKWMSDWIKPLCELALD